MTSQCPDGSSNEAVACLLRLVADNTNPGWNWNPLNFAVTAAIGLLALIVAGITVFQGLLAAGPGRIKASSLAVGPFSVHSRSKFDSTELALRTTARVPLISWDVVYHRIVRQKFRPSDETSGTNSQLNPYLTLRTSSFTAKKVADDDVSRGPWSRGKFAQDGQERRQYDSTATWLNLLASLGLDDPQLFPLIQRVTDYLPADVQAAPAAGELRCLAILAVVADTNATIELSGPGNRFPRVSADSSQLVFRDHPSLGTVAAYEAYEETAMLKVGTAQALQFGTRFSALRFEDLDRCLQLASGRLAYADGRVPPSLDGQADPRTFLTLIKDLWERSRGCGHDVCAHAYDDWMESFHNLKTERRAWKSADRLKSLYMVASLANADRANLCRGFPKRKMNLQEALRDTLDLDLFWRTDLTFRKVQQLTKLACRTFWKVENMPMTPSLSASWVVDFKTTQSTIPNPFDNHFPTARRQYFKEESTSQLMQRITATINRWTDLNHPPVDEFSIQKPTSAMISTLLACLDEWLLRSGGRRASCSMLQLLYKLGARLQVMAVTGRKVIEDTNLKDFLHPASGTGFAGPQYARQASVVDGDDFQDVSMSTLLVLRGVLFVILLDNGTDTSVLYDTGFRNSVVRML